MLIVYQSLESTGTKEDRPSTFITGNSFKRKVHQSLPQKKLQVKSRVWHEKKVVFKKTESTTPFATYEESNKLSKTIKALDKSKQDEIALEMLGKIVERIVDNAAACTRPPGDYLPFVRPPDVIVLGEVYASSLMGKVFSGYVVIGGVNPTGDARHRFTVLVQTWFDGKNPNPTYANSVQALLAVGPPDEKNKDELSKCMMIKVRGWLIAFVHTPNNVCNDDDRATDYLHNNAERFGKGSHLDLVIGDTNQASSDTVKEYMNDTYNRKIFTARKKLKQPGAVVDADSVEGKEWKSQHVWKDSITLGGDKGPKKQIIRGYTNYEVSGTNSGYDKHFDIACARRDCVRLKSFTLHDTQEDELTYDLPSGDQSPAFVFHGLTDKFLEWKNKYYAYSDHNGVIVEILRDKKGFQYAEEKVRRRKLVEEFQSAKKRTKVE